MLDVFRLPVTTVPRADARLAAHLEAEGDAAFHTGLPITACPDFTGDGFADHWRAGYRRAKEARMAKVAPNG